ncbi:MAG: 4Fe-4S dicluster domain-containing protein [Gammaproteobacteria bacterium]|nr:4Fe-4S dicluster domain-containing protein [Gammaproteobacteria bacterium]
MKWTPRDARGLDDVLIALSDGREVYAPVKGENGSFRLSKSATWRKAQNTLGTYRPTEPLKSLFFPPREFIGAWESVAVRPPMPERIVFGVKNCDLSSLAIFDHVFLEGVAPDPYYSEARRRTVLVASDCGDHRDVCFCPAVGEQPWPKAGYDINIAQAPSGVLLEEGSERGAELLASVAGLLQEAPRELIEAVEAQREQHYRELAEDCAARGIEPGSDLQGAVEGAFESALWSEFAEHCVECGACNFICCTCHCFLLADGLTQGGQAGRTKLWDACLYNGFARTAGGGTPRPLRAERLRNRFDKKFSYFPQVMGRYACDGCGRCTEACIAKIDIRDVLNSALEHVHTG